MSRWLEKQHETSEGGGLETLSRSGTEKRPRTVAAESEEKDFGKNHRERIVFREREYSIRGSERETLFEIGRFRIIGDSDLVNGIYSGRHELAQADLRALRAQNLVHAVSYSSGTGEKLRAYALSVDARDLVTKSDPRIERDGQRIYAGFVKPREVQHDVLLYRAFRHEAQRLRLKGGQVRRVVLDHELKQKLFSRQGKERSKKPFREIQAETSRELHLHIVEGRVMIPDFRLEYENERGGESRVDVEVATGNYREAQLAAKASAGFRVYGGSEVSVDTGQMLKGRVFGDERSGIFPL